MKITMYELLGLVKDDKAPKKFIYDNQLFILDEEDNVYRSHLGNRFGAMYQLDVKLNDEIEILDEEKKIPEKLNDINSDFYVKDCYYEKLSKEEIALDLTSLKNRINSIIDYLKSKGE